MADSSPEHNNSAASDSDTDCIKNGELFMKKLEAKNKAANNKSKQIKPTKATKPTAKTESKKPAKDWIEDDTGLLIDILESKPCLWDVHHADYMKRDIKEVAYSEMAATFDTNTASIKQKINNLRTRFGKDLSKERTTKSGQATNELYISN